MNWINSQNLEGAWSWGMLLVVFSLFIDPNIQALSIIPLALISAVWFFRDTRLYLKKYASTFHGPLALLFLIIVLGYFNSENKQEAVQVIIRNLPFLFMPLLLLPLTHSNLSAKRIFLVFQSGILFFGTLCLGRATWIYYETGSAFIHPGATHFVYNIFMSHLLVDPFGLHPIFLSFFILLGSVSIVQFFGPNWKSLSTSMRAGLLVLLGFHLLLIFLLKSVLFSFLYPLSVFLVLSYQLRNRITKSTRYKALFGIALTIAIVFGSFNAIKKLETTSFDYSLQDAHMTSIKMRMALWECAVPIIKSNPLIGVGTGDQSEVLFDSYINKNFKIPVDSDIHYNTHNQYLQYAVGYGIFTSFLFVVILFVSIYRAFGAKNPLYLTMILGVVLFSFTESTLQTQTGIVSITLLLSIFYYHPNIGLSQSS